MRTMQSVTLGFPQVHGSIKTDSNPTIKAGQILFGKINTLYPNQMAEVQIGHQKIVAQLETPLQEGERYLFQVQQHTGHLLLKVVDSPATPTMNGKETAKQIVSHLGVAINAESIELADFLLKNQLPITKDSFQLAMQWLKQADSPKEGIMALKTMYMQQLPFVEDVFKALFTQAKGESFHGMLRQLLTEISSSANQTVTTVQLKEVLESLVAPKQGQVMATELHSTDLTNGSAVSAHLKDMAKLLGLQFEHVLANAHRLDSAALNEEVTTLKPLLFKLLQEQQPATVKELVDQIVNRITAQQIMSQENGPLQNLLLTLPLQLGKFETDLTMQWSGRKRKDGSMDPNYCRILFYLDLEQLQETVIDMQVQNRVVQIVVFNEQSERIEPVAAPFIGLLRKNLEEKDYKLTGVLFENTIKKQSIESQKQLMFKMVSSYSGVDIRI